MSTLLTANVTERLLIICIVVFIAVYCVYWATRPRTNFQFASMAVKRLRRVQERQSISQSKRIYMKPYVANESKPPCGFERFRSVARQRADGYVPGSGTWSRNGTHIQRFHPSVCQLTHGKWIPEDELVACLHRHRVRYVAIIGDSNGRWYLRTLHRLFSEAPVGSRRHRIVCGPVIRHNGLSYASYRSPHVLVKHRCPCSGYCTLEFTLTGSMRFVHCYVLQARCTVDNAADVVFEYITSWFTIDPKVQYTSKTGCQRSAWSPVESTKSNTTQGFLLGEYFLDPQPDILLVFSNTHDEMKLGRHAVNVDHFARLIDQLVPASTRVIWASRHAEDDSKKPSSWRNKRYVQDDGRKLTRLQWLKEANRILYSKMRQRFIDGRRPTIMFPDLLAMSQLALKDLNKDGVHMYDDWYQSVMSFVLQSLCHDSPSTTPSG